MLPTDYYFIGNTASHNDKKILSLKEENLYWVKKAE